MSDETTDKAGASQLVLATKQDLADRKGQAKLLFDFISKQLKEANFKEGAKDFGEGDYGIIPGTKKKVLLKPGAEKILRLFNLGVRVRMAEKEIDLNQNFALFIYRAEVVHLRSNVTIAECEGSANSQEVKYRERTVWRKNAKGVKESVKEETPVCDVLNTLMKMAQKRAVVGATILATAVSDFFTHDVESEDEAEAVGMKAKVDPSAREEKEVEAEVEEEDAPECCGQPMMISKYRDRQLNCHPFYCVTCRKKIERAS